MNPIKILALTLALLAASAAAQTLYFYPPDDAKWIAGRAYISQGSAATAVALELDATAGRCGWYKVSIPSSSSSPLRNYAQFWLGKPGKDRIGPNGRWSVDFEPGDDFNAVGGVFRLGDIFSSLGNNVYFVADELDPANPDAGWYSSLPAAFNDASRCEFNLAAFIYDTDPSVHPDFSCGIWKKGESCGNGADTECACREEPKTANLKGKCTGVIKNLVKPTLNAATRKIEYNGKSNDPNNCWTSEADFNNAFKSTPGVNVEHCYNMPFTQIKSGTGAGSFEFDSDKMLNASGRLVGGFFPEILNSAPNNSSCPTCNTKRSADRFIPRITALTKDIFDAYQSAEGDFKDGDTPKRGVFNLTPASEPIYDWGNPRNNATWFLHGTSSTSLKNTYGDSDTQFDSNAKANQHFCFESHADFYYDPAQKFYFSGDDPIWVYINNKLVIDLGGAHMAAPGSVDLSKQGLTEGELYPIDIFFCDQRTVNSNVRITTNMYVVQRSSFESDIQPRNNTFCADIQGGSDCASKMGGGSSGKWCGNDLISNGYKVEFYMVRRGNATDTTHLSPSKNAGNCTGSGENDFVCYAGIKAQNAVYSCGGRGECRGHPETLKNIQNLAGNFNVYARLRGPNGTVSGKPIMIDQIKSDTKTRMVWGTGVPISGTAEKKFNNAYNELTAREQWIIAGKRTPIYVANASWSDEGNPVSFDYDDEEAGGTAYSVSVSGGNGLAIYERETGDKKKTSGNLPASGIDTLWVEGGYEIGNKDFELKVDKDPPLKLHVYQPVLKFTESNFTTVINSPSGWDRWKTAEGRAPYANNGLEIYIAALDPRRDSEVCGHCTFPLTAASTTNSNAINAVWGKNIVKFSASGIENGKLATKITGQDEVVQSDLASIKITGPSADITFAEWTGLQFRLAPVPTPKESEIFDRNGDGIGDSITVIFSKSFKGGGSEIKDTLLLVLLEVVWEKGDTVRFHAPDYEVSSLKSTAWIERQYDRNGKPTTDFSRKNGEYWRKFIYAVDANDSLNVLRIGWPAGFSKNIATRGYASGKGEVRSYAPAVEDGIFQYSENGYTADLNDRIPPIVKEAKFTASNAANCEESSEGCSESLEVTLSEPVFADPSASNEGLRIKNPFSYCFALSQKMSQNPGDCPLQNISDDERHDLGWNNSGWSWEVAQARNLTDTASSAVYRPANSGKLNTMTEYSETVEAAKGDSIVAMSYRARKINGESSRMPKGEDWIKIRSDLLVFRDANGNAANPREIGVPITGTNPSSREYIRIANIKPGTKPEDPSLQGIFDPSKPESQPPPWLGERAIEAGRDLFKPGNVAEFLPVPKEYSTAKDISNFYPSSVGTLFSITSALRDQVDKIVNDCEGCKNMDGDPLSKDNIAKGITIHANAYYHTNLGNYTADRKDVVANCKDEIFWKNNGGGGDDCFGNMYNFYLAWNLKTNANRFVGAGAYVAINKFYLQIQYKNASGGTVTKKLGQQEFIEMFGVSRGTAAPKKEN